MLTLCPLFDEPLDSRSCPRMQLGRPTDKVLHSPDERLFERSPPTPRDHLIDVCSPPSVLPLILDPRRTNLMSNLTDPERSDRKHLETNEVNDPILPSPDLLEEGEGEVGFCVERTWERRESKVGEDYDSYYSEYDDEGTVDIGSNDRGPN